MFNTNVVVRNLTVTKLFANRSLSIALTKIGIDYHTVFQKLKSDSWFSKILPNEFIFKKMLVHDKFSKMASAYFIGIEISYFCNKNQHFLFKNKNRVF